MQESRPNISADDKADIKEKIREENHECPICHRQFKTQNSLKMHKLRAHRISPQISAHDRGRGLPFDTSDKIGLPPDVSRNDVLSALLSRAKIDQDIKTYILEVAEAREPQGLTPSELYGTMLTFGVYNKTAIALSNLYSHKLQQFGLLMPDESAIQFPIQWTNPSNYGRRTQYSTHENTQSSFLEQFLLQQQKTLEDTRKELIEAHKAPSFMEQLASIFKVAEMFGFRQGGRTTIDVVDKGIDKLDSRIQEGFNLLTRSPVFNPQITRTPLERYQKVREIQTQLATTEEIISKEDEFVADFYDMLNLDQGVDKNKHYNDTTKPARIQDRAKSR